jgi:hypothetical protein
VIIEPQLKPAVVFQSILLLLYIDTAFSVTTKSIRTAGRVKRAKEYSTSIKGRQIKGYLILKVWRFSFDWFGIP